MILEARGFDQHPEYQLRPIPKPMVDLFRAETHKAQQKYSLMDPIMLGTWAIGEALVTRTMDRLGATVFRRSNRYELIHASAGIIPRAERFLHSDFAQSIVQQSTLLSTGQPHLEMSYELEEGDNQVVSARLGDVSLYYGLNGERSFQVNAGSDTSLQESLELELNTRKDGVPYTTTPGFYFRMVGDQFSKIGSTRYSDRVRRATIRFEGAQPYAEFDVFKPADPTIRSTFRYHILEKK